MDLYNVVGMAHAGMGVLLFTLALFSISVAVISAVRPATDQANEKFVRWGNKLGTIECVIAIMIGLSGLVILNMDDAFSIDQLWIWMSLVIVTFYCLMLIYITKPARETVSSGGSAIKTGMQVLLQTAHVLLIIVAFSFMLLKPGLQ